jgi:hypothetical protein
MYDIRNIIVEAVNENIGMADPYLSTIDFVADKLIERDYAIADNIITTLSSVASFNASPEMVENALRESGLMVRSSSDPGDVINRDATHVVTSPEDRLTILEAQVAQLMGIARKLAPSEF